MTKSQSIILNNIVDPINLPLDIIENAIRYKLSLLDDSKDVYVSLGYYNKNKHRKTIIKMSHISDVKTNVHFIVDAILTSISICRIENIHSFVLTYGNQNSETRKQNG